MPSTRDPGITIEPMTADDWPDVRRIYTEGIATGDATLEREAPDWGHFDRSHPTDCRLVARSDGRQRRRLDGARRLFGAPGLQRRRVGERLRRRRPPRGRGRRPESPRSAHRGLRGGRLLDAPRRCPGRERARASPSINASGSARSASSAGSARMLADAGGTSSSSNGAARIARHRLNVPSSTTLPS